MHWWSQPIFQFPQEFQARYLIRERVKLVNESEQNKKKTLWFILFWKEYSVSSFFIEPHFCSPVIFLTWNCHIVLLIVYVCSHTRVPAESRREHPIALWATQCSWLELNSGPWKQQQLLSEQMSHLSSPLLHFF